MLPLRFDAARFRHFRWPQDAALFAPAITMIALPLIDFTRRDDYFAADIYYALRRAFDAAALRCR